MTAPQNDPRGPVLVGAALLLALLFGLAQQATPPPAAPTTSAPATTTAPRSTTTAPLPTTTIAPTGGDDTAALVAAIAAGNVTIDRPLTINSTARVTTSNRTITFTGAGELRRTTSTNPTGDSVTFPVLQLVDVENVRIVAPKITGPGGVCDVGGFRARYDARYEESAGISLDGARDVTIEGGTIRDVRGDGVRIFFARTAGRPDVVTERVQIRNLTTRCVGRAAVTNVRSNAVTVSGGDFALSGLWTFNVEPLNAWQVSGYRIEGPRVGYSTSTWLLVGGPRFSCKAEVTVVRPVFTELVQPESVASCVRPTVVVQR